MNGNSYTEVSEEFFSEIVGTLIFTNFPEFSLKNRKSS